MAIGSLSPVASQQFFDASGRPLAGGTLGFFLAGTDTPSPAYADVGLTTPLANPVVLDAAGRAPALFLAALSYKEVLKDAGGVTIWTVDNIVTPTALRSTQSSISLTGTQDNVPIPAGVITSITFQNASPVSVSGFAGGTPGQILIVRAGQLSPVHLLHTQGSAPGNQLYNFVNSGPTSLTGPNGVAIYIYQQPRPVDPAPYWVLITHEQGAWLRVPYSSANFTVDGAGTWVVDAGDVGQMDYRLSGTSLLMTFNLQQTQVTGTPGQLRIGGWPYTLRTGLSAMPAISSQATANPTGFGAILVSGIAGQSLLALNQANLAAWTAASNIYVNGQVLTDVN